MFRSPSVPPLIVDNWQGPDRRHYSKTADHWKTAAVSTTASCFLSMTSALREEIGWFKISRFWAEKRKKWWYSSFQFWQHSWNHSQWHWKNSRGGVCLFFCFDSICFEFGTKRWLDSFSFPVDFWFHIKCISHYFCFVFFRHLCLFWFPSWLQL